MCSSDLESSLTLIKYGGHADQLSRTVPVLDKYRIQSLDTLYKSTKDYTVKIKVKDIMTKKLLILINGAQKRNLTDDVKYYEDLLISLA